MSLEARERDYFLNLGLLKLDQALERRLGMISHLLPDLWSASTRRKTFSDKVIIRLMVLHRTRGRCKEILYYYVRLSA